MADSMALHLVVTKGATAVDRTEPHLVSTMVGQMDFYLASMMDNYSVGKWAKKTIACSEASTAAMLVVKMAIGSAFCWAALMVVQMASMELSWDSSQAVGWATC